MLPNCALKLRKWHFNNRAVIFVTVTLVIRLYSYPLGVNNVTSKKITTYRILFLSSTDQSFANFPPLHVLLHGTDDEVYFFTKIYVSSRCTFARKYSARTVCVQHRTLPISTTLFRMSERTELRGLRSQRWIKKDHTTLSTLALRARISLSSGER